MARIEKTVFISYRRKDISWALAVYQDLTHHGYDVFFDYTSIPSGDFEQIIISNIKARAHFVLILTPTTLDRCGEPGDWLRREVEVAIDEKRNITPLFFDGFNFGNNNVSEKLTGKLKKVSQYNGMNVHQDFFLEAMERLRNKFLNVPLNAVLHPVSAEVQEVVLEEQRAANKAAEEAKARAKWEAIEVRKKKQKEFINRISKLISSNIHRFGIGGIILIGILGILFVGNYIFNNLPVGEMPEFTSSATLRPAMPITTMTLRPITSTATETLFTPTITFTPSLTTDANPTKVSEQDGMVMVYVPEGEFTVGVKDPADYSGYNQIPAQSAYVSAFWIDQTEITNAMYGKCVDSGQCNKPLNEYENNIDSYFRSLEFQNFPVIYIDWYMASIYCRSVGRRLPSEAEWEKAARGTDGRRFPWGNDDNNSLRSYAHGNLSDIAEVGIYPLGASPYGVLDMEGNVEEWVGDIYQVYTKQREHKIARVGVESRYGWDPSSRYGYLGFRCAIDADH